MGMMRAAKPAGGDSERASAPAHAAAAPPGLGPQIGGGAMMPASGLWRRLATRIPVATAAGDAPGIQRLCSACEQKRERQDDERDPAPPMQPRLAVAPPDDAFEQQADAVARRVLSRAPPAAGLPGPASIRPTPVQGPPRMQRQCGACSARAARPDEERLQAKAAAEASVLGPVAPAAALRGIAAPGAGAPLPAFVRARVEPVLGASLAAVRVHRDQDARDAAASIGARAFTHRNHIFLGPGERADDLGLMAHELTHTVQQGASPALAGAPVGSGAAPAIQRWPSWDDVVDTVEDTVSDAGDALESAGEAVAEKAEDIGGAIADKARDIGEGVVEAGAFVAEKAEDLGEGIVETAGGAIDWLATEAGELAQDLADAFDGVISISRAGLVVRIPKFCPLPALSLDFKLPTQSAALPIAAIGIPIGPVAIVGTASLVGHFKPLLGVQIGPFCLNGARIVINPLSLSSSISGSVSAAAALSLGAEVRAGVRGSLSLVGVIPIGGVPVPISIPVLDLEGGVAGLVRGMGAGNLTIAGGLSVGGGLIRIKSSTRLDVGLAADLFAGAYGELSLLGRHVCRIYWEPLAWHGDIGASLGVGLGLTLVPGVPGFGIPVISPPTLGRLPFDQLPVALSRKGFSDDCPVVDRLCTVLKALGLLPSQNGGTWSWSGPYGPGPRLAGPLPVWQRSPGIASGATCRGACGPDCDTCTPKGRYRWTDPATGDVWEYTHFEDCRSNDGCREHDAAFDWAADRHGEIGKGAIFMPWHMAANVECACNNLAGNCVAWIAGLPPYDRHMLFADTASRVSTGGGGGGAGGPAGGGCRDSFPNAPPCDPSRESDRQGALERWGAANGIADFRDCRLGEDLERTSMLGCDGGPGNVWDCEATDGVTGEALAISIFECICCDPSDARDAGWRRPQVVVVDGMSEELLLELCDRDLIARVICIPLEENMIGRFGNRRRNIGQNPDTDPKEPAFPRPDDTPIYAAFRRIYNRLDSWSLFIRAEHPDWYGEFARQCDPTRTIERQREDWLTRLKARGDDYKKQFRNLRDTDVETIQHRYEKAVLGGIAQEIETCIQTVAVWYKAKAGLTESPAEITERVHTHATEIWRTAWRRAILQVNRVLSRLWPPAKIRILVWVGQQRARHPGVDLSGNVGELDYIGSLATGYKGPPKQQIRFNPSKFDVDANLDAPPLSKYAVHFANQRPKHGRIFGRVSRVDPLIEFADQTDAELARRVDGYDIDPGDPFDVALATPDLPEQARSNEITHRLYELRASMDADAYAALLAELGDAGLLKESGDAVHDDLTEAQLETAREIIDRHAPPP